MLRHTLASSVAAVATAAVLLLAAAPTPAAAQSLDFHPFNCAVNSVTHELYFRCYTKTVDNTCTGINLRQYAEDGSYTVAPGAAGYDPCQYTTCGGLACEHPDATYTRLSQSYGTRDGGNIMEGCQCLRSGTGGAGEVPAAVTVEGVVYEEGNPDAPVDESNMCIQATCPATAAAQGYTGEGLVVLRDSQCQCMFPRRAYIWRPQYTLYPIYLPSTLSLTDRPTTTTTTTTEVPTTEEMTTTTEEGTPDPIIPETTTTTTTAAPTPDPRFARLREPQTIHGLCPNAPAAMTPAIMEQEIDQFCCTVFGAAGFDYRGCGRDALAMMPLGVAYCQSTIPSFEYCCDVERMRNDVFVYRGDNCTVPVAATTTTTAAPGARSR